MLIKFGDLIMLFICVYVFLCTFTQDLSLYTLSVCALCGYAGVGTFLHLVDAE